MLDQPPAALAQALPVHPARQRPGDNMAISWTAKAPGDIYRYTWTPALAEGDSLASYTVTESGAVVDSDERDGDSVIVFVSGGTAGTIASFAFTAVSSDGESLTETVYLPITATTAAGTTARDICLYALRKVSGVAEEPDADELADALERLNDMLRTWKAIGADVGVTFPILDATVFNIRDSFIAPIKANLLVEVSEIYGTPLTGKTASDAIRGMQHVKTMNLPDTRSGEDYF